MNPGGFFLLFFFSLSLIHIYIYIYICLFICKLNVLRVCYCMYYLMHVLLYLFCMFVDYAPDIQRQTHTY